MLIPEKIKRKNVLKESLAVQKQPSPAARKKHQLLNCNQVQKIIHLPVWEVFFACLKNLLQFIQVCNDIGGPEFGGSTDVVHKNRIHSGIHGTLYIRIQVVADHDRFVETGIGLLQGIFKNLFFRLHTVTGFRCDYLGEKMIELAVT